MAKPISATLSALALLGVSLAVTSPAHAVKPVQQGSMRLSAERLVSIGVSIPADPAFYLVLFPAAFSPGLQFPRVGFDYFVIDGLSVGASAGMAFYSGDGSFSYALLPRVGYAFDLSKTFEFWPRGGLGVMGFDDNAPGSTSSAILQFEGIFSYEMYRHVLLQFGPSIDVALANTWPVDIGGNAGIAIDF
jgi:hypothetical protein